MKQNIPFFSLDREYTQNKTIINSKVLQVLQSQKFVGGPFVGAFEQNMSNYIKAKHTISCNSGTDALWLALKALKIKKNDIVLTTPFSFIASSSEIAAHGAHPVFIDIDPDTYNIDPQKIKAWIDQNTEIKNNEIIEKKTGYRVTGIVTVDIFGQCADYDAIQAICKKYNLWIIQDSCQSIGSQDINGKMAGTHADISCFSFYPTKNLGAYGDGGCCTTNNPELAELLMQLKNHGRTSHYNYITHGINSRMDAIQAEILSAKLENLDKKNDARRAIAATYNKNFKDIAWIKTPQEINGKHVFHQYCIEINQDYIKRDEFCKQLQEMGVGNNVYYPKSLDLIPFLNKETRLQNPCPVSTALTQNIVALPIWPELTSEEVAYVCECVKSIAGTVVIKENKENVSTCNR